MWLRGEGKILLMGERQKAKAGKQHARKWSEGVLSETEISFWEEIGKNITKGVHGSDMERLKQNTSPVLLGRREFQREERVIGR